MPFADPLAQRPILVPRSLDALGGPYVDGTANVLALKDGRGLAKVTSLSEPVPWLEKSSAVCVQVMRDGQTLKAFRLATGDDYRHHRVPIWIQGTEVPSCCERPMIFVGQLDDDRLCTERPPDARFWWHDAASFYVFTCGQCLGVKAVGQQF